GGPQDPGRRRVQRRRHARAEDRERKAAFAALERRERRRYARQGGRDDLHGRGEQWLPARGVWRRRRLGEEGAGSEVIAGDWGASGLLRGCDRQAIETLCNPGVPLV